MKLLSGILVSLGVMLMATAFFYPRTIDPESLWSEQQLKERTEIGHAVHHLAHEHSHDPDQAERIEKRKAETMDQYRLIQAELDSARERPQRIAAVLRWLGAACAILGAGLYYVNRPV